MNPRDGLESKRAAMASEVINVPSKGSSGFESLSPREREVLTLIAQGLRTEEIAQQLHRSVPTIKSHRQQLGKKLGVRSRVDLARAAIAAGLVMVDPAREGVRGLISLARAIDGLGVAAEGDVMMHLAMQLAASLSVRGAVIAEFVNVAALRTLAFVADGRGRENVTLDARGCPCAKVLDGGSYAVAREAQRLYPGATHLAALNAECYVGRVIVSSGTALGLVTVFDSRARDDARAMMPVIDAYAARVRAEMLQRSGTGRNGSAAKTPGERPGF